MMRRGMVIALSGIDSSGKSTQRRNLEAMLTDCGLSPRTIWSRPGYTPGLGRLRRLLRIHKRRRSSPKEGISGKPGQYPQRAATLPNPVKRRLWLTVAQLDLLWLYAVWIRWLRALGRSVICDRYLLDGMVDFRVNFPDDQVERRLLFRLLRRCAVRPDAAFCLLIPPQESQRRSRQKARYHWETEEILDNRHAAYLAAGDELGVTVLDGTRSTDEISTQMRETIRQVLPGSGCGERWAS